MMCPGWPRPETGAAFFFRAAATHGARPDGRSRASSAEIQNRLTRLSQLPAPCSAGSRNLILPSMRARHFLHLVRVSLCVLVMALAASAADAREMSVQEAVAKVQQETNGKVLSVQTLTIGKRKVYRIKVLTLDGQVRVVQVPAEQ